MYQSVISKGPGDCSNYCYYASCSNSDCTMKHDRCHPQAGEWVRGEGKAAEGKRKGKDKGKPKGNVKGKSKGKLKGKDKGKLKGQ